MLPAAGACRCGSAVACGPTRHAVAAAAPSRRSAGGVLRQRGAQAVGRPGAPLAATTAQLERRRLSHARRASAPPAAEARRCLGVGNASAAPLTRSVPAIRRVHVAAAHAARASLPHRLGGLQRGGQQHARSPSQLAAIVPASGASDAVIAADVGSASAQGLRGNMEDSMHVGMDAQGQYLFVGMYDGHGGTQAAEWLQDNLHSIMSKHVTCLGPGSASSDAMRDAMGAAFADADAALLAHLETLAPEVLADAGSTGTVAIVAPGRVHVANIGDSAAVLLRKGRPLDLTMPHRVYGAGKEVMAEKARVQATGAWVYDGRVCNILAVSRAFGDWEFKQVGGLSKLLQAGVQREYWDQSWADKNSFTSDPIIVEPAFSATELCDDDELLVVATDGLWDVCPQADVMRFAKNKLKLGQPAKKVAEGLVATALQRKTTDNVSVVVIDLKGPDHWSESNGGGLLGGLFGRR